MHRLLRRQLRKHLGVEDEVPEPLKGFVAAVDAAYADFDSDRAMLERSLEISSQELSETHEAAKQAPASVDRRARDQLAGLFSVRLRRSNGAVQLALS